MRSLPNVLLLISGVLMLGTAQLDVRPAEIDQALQAGHLTVYPIHGSNAAALMPPVLAEVLKHVTPDVLPLVSVMIDHDHPNSYVFCSPFVSPCDRGPLTKAELQSRTDSASGLKLDYIDCYTFACFAPYRDNSERLRPAEALEKDAAASKYHSERAPDLSVKFLAASGGVATVLLSIFLAVRCRSWLRGPRFAQGAMA
jgi:hypothetical protein